MVEELVTLDGFPLTGITRDGIWKRLGELEGWFDSPDPKRDSVSRVNGDGKIWTEVNFESRLITFTGRVISTNHGYLHEAGNRLASLPGRGKKKFVVRGHGPTQWAMVDPRGKVSVTFPTDSRMEFQIPLEAVDPFKYGEQNEGGGFALGSSQTFFHRGTEDAWPVVTVSGSAPGGYVLNKGGRQVRVTVPLVSGVAHTVDMRTGILRVGSSRVYGAITTAEYWSISPGPRQTVSASVITTGSGTVQLDYFDTYI